MASRKRPECAGPIVHDDDVDATDYHICEFVGDSGALLFDKLIAEHNERKSQNENDDDGESRVFYVDAGRFHYGVRRALKAHGWRQLLYCERGRRERRSLPLTKFFDGIVEFVWIKNRGRFPYSSGVAGHCIVNHIPTEWELTKKDRLADNLQRYEDFLLALNDVDALGEFAELPLPVHPRTYRLRDWNECKQFIGECKRQRGERSEKGSGGAASSSSSAGAAMPTDPKHVWILKPSKGSGGHGISVHSDMSMFVSDYERCRKDPRAWREKTGPGRFMMTGLVMQRYIARPLLIEGRKFDVRSYFYLADVEDQLLFYADGYVRVNAEPYDTSLSDLSNRYKHLSNVSVQKRHPDFEEIAETMRWKFAKFQEYLTERKLAPPGWVERSFRPQMKLQMWYAFKSCAHKMSADVGFFSLVGADFVVDEHLRVWLIEFSKSPAVYRSASGLFSDRFRDMIAECANVQLEIFDRKRAGHSFAPGKPVDLKRLDTFELCRPEHQSAPFIAPPSSNPSPMTTPSSASRRRRRRHQQRR
jgi:Tubulin-tyrosine ligase family